MKKLKNWAIVRTLFGRNSTGRKLYKVLPLRKQREFLGEVIKGVKDLLPIPQVKDASLVKDAEKIKVLVDDLPNDLQQFSKQLQEYPTAIYTTLVQIKDLLDDGRHNNSTNGLSPELKFKIRLGTSVLLSAGALYQLLAVIFGWPTLPLFYYIGA